MSAEEYFDRLYKNRNEQIKNVSSIMFRRDENTSSVKKPIIISGCSFAWGAALKDNQTISYKIGHITGRPVYNRAGSGWGLSHFLYQIRKEYFFKNHREPEYIIYVFLYEHFNRLGRFKISPLFRDFQPEYKIKNNTLYEIKPKLIDYTAFAFTVQMHRKKQYKDFPKTIKTYFLETAKEIKKHWKNTKLVILKYPVIEGIYDYDSSSMWQELKNEGIIVLDAAEYAGEKILEPEYKIDGFHPSAEAWDLILPGLISELKL